MNYADTAECIVAGAGIGDGVAGVPTAFTLQSMDAFGNKRLEGGDTIVVSRDSVDNVMDVTVSYTTDGLYEISFTQGANPRYAGDPENEIEYEAGQVQLIVTAGKDADSLQSTRTGDGLLYRCVII